MIASRKASLLIAMCVSVVALLGGCAVAAPEPRPAPAVATTTTTATDAPTIGVDPQARYVSIVNGLCEETMTSARRIVPAYYSAETPVAQYRRDAPALRAIAQKFDRELAAVPVPAAAQEAASAFRAYVVASDRNRAAALAATGSQATFAAEFVRQLGYWTNNNPILAARDEFGFSADCNYR